MSSQFDQTVTAVDFEGNQHQIKVTKLAWRPSAYGIVIKDGQILLLKQTNGYDLPGGGLEFGETPEQAVIREIKEESGLTAANPVLFGVETSFYKPNVTGHEAVQSLMFYYKCELVGGELSTDGFDEFEQVYAIGPEWLPLEELPGITLGTSVNFRKYIKQA